MTIVLRSMYENSESPYPNFEFTELLTEFASFFNDLKLLENEYL